MLGLLALATVLAYYVQESFSRRSVQIHLDFARKQETISSLRRDLWMGGILSRDYFLNKDPNRRESFERQLQRLRGDTGKLLNQLVAQGTAPSTVAELEHLFSDLYTVLATSAEPGKHFSEPYEFIQREVVPRRDAAGGVLRQLERANSDALSDSVLRFTASRSTAASSLMYLLGACVIGGGLVAVLSLRYSAHLEKEAASRFKEVSAAKQQLERLSARLMEIQEEERTRLSRELHDEIVQNLAVIKLELTRLASHSSWSQTDLRERLNETRNLTDRTMRSVRDISMLLRPSLLDDLGLIPALQAQAEDFSRRTGTRCEVEESGISEDLSGQVKTCIYRVVQEALRNCEKHSQATKVQISVVQSAVEISAEVRDNGVGYNPVEEQRRSPSQLGVLGMKERASALGGTLQLDSAPNKGTVMRLSVPTNQKRPEDQTMEVLA